MFGAEVLVERSGTISTACGVLQEASTGKGGALFVVGDAGLGKTAILDEVCRLSEKRGFSVGRGRGEAMETSLPFGLLAQAFDHVGGSEVLQGRDGGPLSPDIRAAQFYAVLRWLERHGSAPVLLALDDLHWADADSLALTSFLCRRIDSLRVAVIATLRPWPPPAADAGSVLAHDGHASIERLTPLTEAGAGTLIATRTGQALSEDDVRRAQELCVGNPLLLEQVALAISRGEDVPQLAGADPREAPGELLLSRFAGLPPDGMRWAQAAAVFGTRFRPELAQRLAQLDEAGADGALEALGRSGLIRQAPAGGVEFVHPLFRQALYEDLADPTRTRLHARAFSLLAGRGLDAEAAEHALRSDMAGDPAAIAVLERVGRSALRTGALETATTVLQAAARTAGDRASHDLLLDLVEALGSGGRPGEAITVGERILGRGDLSTMVRAQALRLVARALLYTGTYEAAAQRFEESAELAKDMDPAFAVQTLVAYGLAAWFFAGPAKALAVSSWARQLAQGCAEEVRRRADAAWGLSRLETGDPKGLELCAAADQAVAADPLAVSEDVSSWRGALVCYGAAARYTERLAEAEHCYQVALEAARRLGAPDQEASLSESYADLLARGLRLDEALELIERAGNLSDLAPLAEPLAGVARAAILLLMGRLEESEACAQQAEPVVALIGAWSPSLWLSYVRAWRLLSEGRSAEACQLYADMEAITARVGIGEPCEVPWASHAVAAYVGCRREDDARRVISWLEECAERLPCRWPRIAAVTGRARLAEAAGDTESADALWGKALKLHGGVDLSVERFQTLLHYGRFLRRNGQLSRARPLLAQAVQLAEGGGAEWLAAQAHEELRIAGGRRRRRHEEPGRLTAQEQRVAHLAAAGATNPEIARQLYLSVSTVETHLERVYAKLGINSRRQLAAATRSSEAPN